jgi:Na+/proline symporter
MHLTPFDWLIVLASIGVSFLPAVWLARRAGSSTAEFFTSGRAAPWWLIGVSMVATTFSTDTPNLVTNLVRQGGVAANWVWWAQLLTGMTTVFFYARLWRRLGVLTDLEFYELRYSGRPASWVRGFRAIYLGLFFNVVIMATVNLAAAKIANVLLGWPMGRTLLICGAINVVFAATSGLWGVLVTDFLQFGVAMTGSFAAAVYALKRPEVGGLAGLMRHVDGNVLRMLPDFGDWTAAVPIFIVPLAVQWWATWYPGAEPGGGSYIAQRMLAAKTERDALTGTLLFNVAHYALRPWPWIIVALSSMIVFPHVSDIARILPQVDPRLLGDDMAYSAMLTFLPEGLLGLMVAGLLAAYVSTLSTHLNWGTSYLVHDFYRRFVRPGESERHYVRVGRVVTALLMVAAGVFTLVLESARDSFNLMLSVGAGTGLLYLLRWFWWRVNAWSEIAAMASSFLLATALFVAGKRGLVLPTHVTLLATIAATTVVWLAATWLTRATDRETLRAFYRKARPAGPGWAEVRRECGDLAPADNISMAFLGWAGGLALVYGALFGAGNYLFGHTTAALVCAVVFVLGAGALSRALRTRSRAERASQRPGVSA